MAKEMKQEDIQANVILNGVGLIQKSMEMAFRANQIAGGGPGGILAILTLMAENIIDALASGYSCSEEKAMEMYFKMIREHMSTLDKDKN